MSRSASILDIELSTADAPVYCIRSLNDFTKIPPKRLKACLRDFRMTIEIAGEVIAKLEAMDRDFAWPMSEFKWRDDNEFGALRDMEFIMPTGERISLRTLKEKRSTAPTTSTERE